MTFKDLQNRLNARVDQIVPELFRKDLKAAIAQEIGEAASIAVADRRTRTTDAGCLIRQLDAERRADPWDMYH